MILREKVQKQAGEKNFKDCTINIMLKIVI